MTNNRSFNEVVEQRLVLVDIENLAGGAELVASTVEEIKSDLTARLALTDNDMVVVASGSEAFLGWAFAWQNVGRRIRTGLDGADYELLWELENVKPGRFSEVVVASGDGIFADSISRLGEKNITVTVVSRASSCSRRLMHAAHTTILYTPIYDLVEAA